MNWALMLILQGYHYLCGEVMGCIQSSAKLCEFRYQMHTLNMSERLRTHHVFNSTVWCWIANVLGITLFFLSAFLIPSSPDLKLL